MEIEQKKKVAYNQIADSFFVLGSITGNFIPHSKIRFTQDQMKRIET